MSVPSPKNSQSPLETRALKSSFGTDGLAVTRSCREAVAAIHGLVSARLERNLGNAAALAARRSEHLALTSAARRPAGFTHGTAIGATVGLVREALHCKKFLLACRKGELASAIHAREHFGCIH
jgi:hypothetical protein